MLVRGGCVLCVRRNGTLRGRVGNGCRSRPTVSLENTHKSPLARPMLPVWPEESMTYRIALATSLVPLILALPQLARAQAACGDTVCPKGYECKSEPLGCPAIDCVEGADCPPCEPTEETYCSPLPCSSDADCDSGMTCATRDVTECTGVAPPCDSECPPAPEPECTTTRVSQCVPNWALPCEAAADCGAGFTCEEVEECGCTGSAGRPGPDAPPTPDSDTDPAPETTPGDCTCEKTGEFACHLVVTACATDDDCADGFTCIENPEGVCSSSSDGTITCEPGDPPRLCVPPYSDIFAGGRGVGLDEGGEGKGTSTPGSASSDDDAADGSSASDGGCSVASGRPSAPGFIALVVAGLAGAFAARRRRGLYRLG